VRPASPFRARLAAPLVALGACVLAGFPALAFQAPGDRPADLTEKMFAAPELSFRNYGVPLSALSPGLAETLRTELSALGADPRLATYDVRGGRPRSLVLATPLVPGPGTGNHLTWLGLGLGAPGDDDAYRAALWQAFRAYLLAHRTTLGIDPGELEPAPNVAVHDRHRLAQVWADRVVDGVPVRGSALSATVNGGNLVLYTVRNWGDVDVATSPSIPGEAALAAVAAHAAPYSFGKPLLPTSLALVPQAGSDDPLDAAPGGYRYRLAWVVTVALDGETGTWESLVDAHSGDLLSFTDVNHYADLRRKTLGAILPLSNDGVGDEGVEQPGHPMPYATLFTADGSTTTTSGTGLAEVTGAFASRLTGPYVEMADRCGPVIERTSCLDLDFGSNPGTDCDTPPSAESPGDTRSARTGFYELNRLIEMWRSRATPGEAAWAFLNGLPTPVLANMNIENACNAFFTPALPSINFYRYGVVVGSSGRPNVCRNTGEIAAVFDHEYGHYLDFMDGNGLSSSSEGYADVVSILRLNDSCVGRGFFVESAGSTNPANPNPFGPDKCSGDGDFCRTCTGVREADWMKRRDRAPHDVDWVNGVNPRHPGSGCQAGPPDPPTPPAPGLSGAPCGSGLVHCEGQIVSEAVVDLYTRDLRCQGLGWEDEPSAAGHDVNGGRCAGDAPPTMSEDTALEIATQLFSAAKGNIQAWFECSNQFGGCNADSGFQQFLAADDDNGTLLDGTPHAVAIFDAFARHQIACPLLGVLVRDAGCGLGNPRSVGGLTVTAGVGSATLDWEDEAGAVEYRVFRGEGVRACATGKALVATLTAGVDGSRYTDTGLLDGFPYAYAVMAVGAPGCLSAMSSCETVIALPPGGAVEDAPSVLVSQGELEVLGGDGDAFLDNCETARLGLTAVNDGNVDFSDARVVAIRPVSHPGTAILTPLPLALGGLASECGSSAAGPATAAFEFTPEGLEHGERLVFEVDVELASEAGTVLGTATLSLSDVETDPFVLQPEVVFDFETGTQGWTVADGTYERQDAPPGGAPAGDPAGVPTTWYMASSRTVDGACDRLRSPAMRLTPTSTLSLFDQFAIEPTSDADFDRANVGLVDAATLARTVVRPSGGRAYTVAGGDGVNTANRFCTEDQPGWNGAGPGWLSSTWSAEDLGVASGPAAGDVVYVDIASGTDGTAAGLGLLVDQVRVTDVLSRGPDRQADNCSVPLAADDAYTAGAQFLAVPPPGVLANDVDGDGDALTAARVAGPSNGTLTLNPDGSFVYTRRFGFRGTDTFTYEASDGVQRSNPATVTITID
jgi:hypothetical protein